MTLPRTFTLLGMACLLTGCSSAPPPKAEPVQVTGTVLLPSGQPVRDVSVNFLPTTVDQIQGGSVIKGDGKFTARLIPGRYTYTFEGTGAKSIPTKYLSNDASNTIEVSATGPSDLTIKLEK